MTIEQDIFNALDHLANSRVYPLVMPEKGTIPAIVYIRIASTPENTLNGGATIDQIRFQVDTYANTYAEAKSLSASVRTAMESASFKGTLQTDQDLFEPDVKLYRVTQDYYVWKRS